MSDWLAEIEARLQIEPQLELIGTDSLHPEDLDFFRQAPTDIRRLIDEVRRLREVKGAESE